MVSLPEADMKKFHDVYWFQYNASVWQTYGHTSCSSTVCAMQTHHAVKMYSAAPANRPAESQRGPRGRPLSGLGLRSRPRWGSLQRSPRPPSWCPPPQWGGGHPLPTPTPSEPRS